jgi:hypothetical protein
MPYDPTPVGPGVDESGRRQSLHVQVEGKGRDAERLYVLGPPRNGVVEVREIVGGCDPREYAERAEDLLDRFERLYRDRRRMSAELYLIREWLTGRG